MHALRYRGLTEKAPAGRWIAEEALPKARQNDWPAFLRFIGRQLKEAPKPLAALTYDEADAARLEGELADAKSTGRSIRAERDAAEAEMERVRQQSADAVSRANEMAAENGRLRQELQAERDKPAKTETVIEQIEVVPPDVEKELDALREKLQRAPSEAALKVRILYAQLVAKFGEVERQIMDLQKESPEEASRYRAAVAKAAEMMANKLACT